MDKEVDVEKLRAKILELADENNPYSQEDFEKEFGKSSIEKVSDTFKLDFKFSNKSTN